MTARDEPKKIGLACRSGGRSFVVRGDWRAVG
jgi:hypothetical protein